MSPRYHLLIRILHWLMAVLLITTLGIGLYMTGMALSPAKLQTYSWHKWLGVSVFFLVLLRLILRLISTVPEHPAHMSVGARRLANLGHWALYVLMFAAPLSGWLMSSATGFQTVWFGVIPLPDLLAKDRALAEVLKVAHHWINYAFIAVIVGHVIAALKHQFIDKDQVFKRISLAPNKD